VQRVCEVLAQRRNKHCIKSEEVTRICVRFFSAYSEVTGRSRPVESKHSRAQRSPKANAISHARVNSIDGHGLEWNLEA
jgi:hypothetical protein